MEIREKEKRKNVLISTGGEGLTFGSEGEKDRGRKEENGRERKYRKKEG